MSTSSAKQTEFEFFEGRTISPPTAGSISPTVTNIPSFDYSSSALAATSRIAGRINAANITKAEHDAWLKERQGLLDKQLAGTITRKEANRLTYVRWSLDRVDDAINGQDLDRLESAVERYERLQSDLHILQTQLAELIPRGRRK